MRQLNGIYTQAFNRRHRKVGHIFQGRFKGILIEKDSYLLELSRYVVLNPVRARMVESPSKWKWTSYGGTGGMAKPHECLTADWLLEQFGRSKKEAQNRYRRFVREGVGGESIWDELKGQTILGTDEFINRLDGYFKGPRESREIPKSQKYLNQPGLSKIFPVSVRGDKTRRDQRIREAVITHGYTQRQVADFLGMHYATLSRLVNQKHRSIYKT